MAAIDIIENMSNKELVDYYKYCMVARFYELKHRGVSYHPNYNYCRVYIGENNIYKLHYANEMSLLNEMWNRMLTSNFSDQCWWKSQKIFQTNISVSFKKEEDWELCYTGKDINRYFLKEANLFFKNNPDEVKAGGSWDMKTHKSKKIVVRQVGNPEPIFAFDSFCRLP